MGKSYRHIDESFDDADYTDNEFDERELRKQQRLVREARKHTRDFSTDPKSDD